MSGDEHPAHWPEDTLLLVNQLCNRFERAWRGGERPRAEAFLVGLDPRQRLAALGELIPLEAEYRQLHGDPATPTEFAARFPEFDPAWLAASNAPQGAGRDTLAAAQRGDEPERTMAAPRRLGDYELLSQLGAGGMGAVYRALHRRMQRVVALKVLRGELNADPRWLARFEREVRAAARLAHPNIVAAFDAREDDGVHYLITEYVDGDDLDRLVKRQGPLPVARAIDCTLQAARGLAYAHQRQVIHRDIKPANLLLDRHGVVKILDMGLARLTAIDAGDHEPAAPADPLLTESGMIMGTAAYMAPEQARDTRAADERSDVYSLGCTLHFLLTGRPLYARDTAVDTIVAHLHEPIPDLAADAAGAPLPSALCRLFRRMVAKNPADRIASMDHVVEELEHCLRDATPAETATATEPTTDPPPLIETTTATKPTARATAADSSPAPPHSPPAGIPAPGLLAAAAGVILAALGGVWLATRGGDAPPLPDPPLANPPPASAAGQFVLEFNGRDSYVAVPSLALDPEMPVTIEVLAQADAHRVSNVLSWLGPNWLALFMSSTGEWGVGRLVGDESRLFMSNSPAAPGTWYHLAATADGGDLTLYINGQRAAMQRVDFPLTETRGGLYIGGVAPGLLPDNQRDRFFAGRIAAVRVSRGLRYRAAFSPPAQLTTDADTLALFAFEAGLGDAVPDATGNHSPGAIVNATWVRR